MAGSKALLLGFVGRAVVAASIAAATHAPAQAQPGGDCDRDGNVVITEVQQCVNVFLGAPLEPCRACDIDGDDEVDIVDLQGVVNCFLDRDGVGCPFVPVEPGICGNGVVSEDEECDDLGECFSGAMVGSPCASSEDCPGGAPDACRPVGGDGCAVNCTLESEMTIVFSGAVCFGGAKNDQPCSFRAFCSGPGNAGRPCTGNFDCAGSACVGECGADSRGCFGDGECPNQPDISCPVRPGGFPDVAVCAGGAAAGLPCASSSDCGGAACVNPCGTGSCKSKSGASTVSLTTSLLPFGPLLGQQRLRLGKPSPFTGLIPVAMPLSGTHFEPLPIPGLACVCVRPVPGFGASGAGSWGAGLINCGAGTIANDVTLAADHSTFPPYRCARGANAGAPCTPRCVAGGERAGEPCGIPGLNPAECPGTGNERQCSENAGCPGGICTRTNGPGVCSPNSANGGRACFDNADCRGTGARCQGRCVVGADQGATCSCASSRLCANTVECGAGGVCAVTGSLGGGICMGPPKFCAGGSRDGAACFNHADCLGGGTCAGTTTGSSNFLAWCDEDSDCPGSKCNGLDDADCNRAEATAPGGSGDSACRETRQVCTFGPRVGQACTSSVVCGPGGSCGSDCNPSGLHADACNSPTRVTVDGSGGAGAALLGSATAVAALAEPALGTCAYAGRCVGGAANGNACIVDLDCSGGQCASAICGGFCTGTNPANQPCLSAADCTDNGVCAQGAGFGTECTAPTACGAGGICIPVEAAKGLDGLACTADDPPIGQGEPQPMFQTTGRSLSMITDANAQAGAELLHLACAGGAIDPSLCPTAGVGRPFDCALLASDDPSPGGALLLSTFPRIDGLTGDEVLSILVRAR